MTACEVLALGANLFITLLLLGITIGALLCLGIEDMMIIEGTTILVTKRCHSLDVPGLFLVDAFTLGSEAFDANGEIGMFARLAANETWTHGLGLLLLLLFLLPTFTFTELVKRMPTQHNRMSRLT